MTTLADLFPDARPDDAGVSFDRRETARRLDALLGGPREVKGPAQADHELARLADLLEAAARTPGVAAPLERVDAASVQRSRPPRDWSKILTAAVAALAMAAAGTVGVIALVTAGPAEGASRALVADEASLANDRQAVAGTLARAQQSVDDGRQQAAELEVALAAVTGMTDETARAAAEQARVEYLAALDSVQLPELPAGYRRGSIDVGSMSEVAAAIDNVHGHQVALDQVASELRSVRDQLAGLSDALFAKVSALGATVVASAAEQNAENPNAADYYREAVGATAAVVLAEQQQGRLGTAALMSYAAAVQALRADEERVLAVVQAEAEAEARDRARRLAEEEATFGTPDPEPYVPPTEPAPPVTPTEPVPPTEPTPPVQPEQPESPPVAEPAPTRQ